MGSWEDLRKKYMWKTRGENCVMCNAMAGRVYTYDTWISASILPGFHLNCNCYLEKVSDDYPVSDLDIFGDLEITLDNNEFLGFSFFPDYKPYNRYFTNELIEAVRQTGLPIGEALKSVLTIGKEGLISKSLTSLWDRYFQWRVFRSLLLLNKSGDGNTISATLTPQVTVPAAVSPAQSHRSGMPAGAH